MATQRAKSKTVVVHDEHRALRQLVDQISELLADADCRPDLWGQLISHLRKELAAHFKHEEQGGYFREEVNAAPWSAEEVNKLFQQHAQFLARIDGLLSRGADQLDHESTRHTFHQFRIDFFDHEARENKLLQEAICHDLGSAD